jgi:ribonucleotide reductase alpha subunit
MTYTYDEALKQSLEYFSGDDFAAKIFVDKYALRNNNGELLEKTPAQMFDRIANELYRIEKNKFKDPLTKDQIYSLLDHFKYIVPQGRILYGCGNKEQYVTLSNCYFLHPPQDSYAGILRADEDLVNISKRGGGVGIDISKLRPNNSPTKNAARTSTGIIPFVERYSNSIREVGQNSRRGAMLLSLNIHHPQALDFITIKRDKKRVVGANISLKVTDEFLQAVVDDKNYEQRFPIKDKYKKISNLISAKKIWKEIIKSVWSVGDPGLLFWDNIVKEDIGKYYFEDGFESIGCNPCISGTQCYVIDRTGYSKLVNKINIGEQIWSKDGWTTVINKINRGVKKIYKYSTDTSCLVCTPNHNIISDGKKREIQNCQYADIFIGDVGIQSAITCKIKKVEYIGEEEVFDITVDNKSHTFECNGFDICNCGEITLSANDSCRLILLNLFSYVQNPFTNHASFNYDLLYKHARITQRLIDDFIDLELECIDRIINKIKEDPEDEFTKFRELTLWKNIKEVCEKGRRTGVGFTGLADVFAALNIRYGSPDSIKIANDIGTCIKFGCYRSSVDMAKELGSFPIWSWEKEKDSDFINRISSESFCFGDGTLIVGSDIVEDMKIYGRRNIMCLTLSPAGTMSNLTKTSSGFEPVFELSYERMKKGNPNDEHFRVDYVDKVGDNWMKFNILHPKLIEWMKITGETDITKSPWNGSCANDINWKDKIKLQATLQQHIDHSISNTLNVPTNITEDEISDIYLEAWKAKLKGITVYRDKSKDGVLNRITTPIDEKRPRELSCDVHHVIVRGQAYFVLVGKKDDKPYEVFAGKNGFLNKRIKTGKIIRKRKDYYKAIFDDKEETELSPITASTSDTENTITRLVSTLLRSNAKINLVVEQLEKVGGDMTGFAKCVARTLKHYIPDGTEVEELCETCKSKLVRENGCVVCKQCGFSKCN